MKGICSLYPLLFISPYNNPHHGPLTLHYVRPFDGNGDKDPSHVTEVESSRRNFLLQVAILQVSSVSTAICQANEIEPSSVSSKKSPLCNQEVSSFSKGDRVVHIIGTAHISDDSAELAGRLVHEMKPEALFLELDRKRFSRAFWNEIIPGITVVYRDFDGRLKSGQTVERKKNILAKFFDSIKEPEDPSTRPGKEFIRAVEEGLKFGSIIVLGDQDVDITTKRILNGFKDIRTSDIVKMDDEFTKLLAQYRTESSGSSRAEDMESLTKMNMNELSDLVESVKTREAVANLMSVFKRNAPRFYRALVTERDQYMAFGIDSLPFQSVVAVMGIGHVDGVSENLYALGWKQMREPC